MLAEDSAAGAPRLGDKRQIVVNRQHNRDRSAAYQVTVEANVATRISGDVLLVNEVDSVTVRVQYLSSTYGDSGAHLFERTFRGPWRFTGTTLRPGWEAGYVPGPEFLLPTGRVILGNGNEILFILFDGNSCRLFSYDDSKWKQEAFDRVATPLVRGQDGVYRGTRKPVSNFAERHPTDKDRKLLAETYHDLFAANDVFWSFAIVKHADFFGHRMDEESQDLVGKQFIQGQELHAAWRRARKTN